MNFHPKRRLAALLVVSLLASLAVACKSNIQNDPILRLSAAESLEEGKKLFAREKYERARPYFSHAFEVEPNSSSGREALPVIEALRSQAKGTERPEAYLGVGLANRTDGGQGAVITSVDPGTPAAKADIAVNDLVVAVDGSTIDGSTGLIAAIRDLEPGDSTELTIMRDGQKQTVEVTLTDRPPDTTPD